MTLVREPGDAAVLESGLAGLTALGRPVFATDGSADPAFAARARAMPGLRLGRAAEGRGLVAQVQASIAAAVRAGVDFICYTEPDKLAFFRGGLARLLDAVPMPDDVGIVLASRTPRAFETFPPCQRAAERAINELTGQFVGTPGDYSYGPFVMRAELAAAALAAPGELGWGWRHFVFGTVSRLGFGVRHVVGDFSCPEDQRFEDQAERLHRLRQLEQNSRGLQWSQDAVVDIPIGHQAPRPRS